MEGSRDKVGPCETCWMLSAKEARATMPCWDYEKEPSRCHRRRADAKGRKKRLEQQRARRKQKLPFARAVEIVAAEAIKDAGVLREAREVLVRRSKMPELDSPLWKDLDWALECWAGVESLLAKLAEESGVSALEVQEHLEAIQEARDHKESVSSRGRLVARAFIHVSGQRQDSTPHAIVMELMLDGATVVTRSTHAIGYMTKQIQRWIAGVLDEWKVSRLITRPTIIPAGHCPIRPCPDFMEQLEQLKLVENGGEIDEGATAVDR
jgi:hypothetical protein